MKSDLKDLIRICRFDDNKFTMSNQHSAHLSHFEKITNSGISYNGLATLATKQCVDLDRLHCKFVFVDDLYFGYHGTMLWAVYLNEKRLHLCWDDYYKFYDMVYDQIEYIDILSNRVVMKSIFESTIYTQGDEVCPISR